MVFVKENGQKVKFDKNKIKKAIVSSMKDGGIFLPDIARLVASDAERYFLSNNYETVTRGQVDKYIFDRLIHYGQNLTAKSYESFKTLRQYQKTIMDTDESILSLLKGKNEAVQKENSNKRATINPTQRDLIAGEISKSIAKRYMIPPKFIQAHMEGIIHLHDLDYWIQNMYNCCLVNLKDMLDNNTVINSTLIDTPHSFRTAATVTTQIIAQVASNQYGGQTFSTAHLAPYVRISEQNIRAEVEDEIYSILEYGVTNDAAIEKIVQKRLAKEVRDGVQTIQYQLNTLMTTNGQAPFVSIAMWLDEDPEYRKENAMIIEEILRQRIIGVKDEEGHYVSPAFPKLLYFVDENNAYEGSEYFYLTELAAQCSANRLVPDYISVKKMRENTGHVFPCMGCRSFLSPWYDNNQQPKFYGRFNMGVVTLNLADAGLSADEDLELFWKILEERTTLCYEALKLRYEKMKGITTEVAPILWEHGAIARLPKGSTIDSLLENGYATISLGYIGLYECVQALIGKSHTTEEGEKLALKIMTFLKDKCEAWKKETGLGFGLYGSPAESTTYRLATTTKNRFGERPNITDKLYLTNSYHVHVTEPIDAFSKLKFESQFQNISSGGCISYVEVPNMKDNIPAMIQLIQYIYENIQYAEINTKADLCENCGYDGEILVDPETLDWYCPNCGCQDHNKLHVTRRTCGYIGTTFWNKGRTAEISDRVTHLD